MVGARFCERGQVIALAIGALIIGLLGFSASAWAAPDIVMSANDSGSGSLREVVDGAEAGAKIVFDASLEGQTIHLSSGAIDIDKSLTIEGLGASQLMIEADHSSRIFTVSSGNFSISGLTFAGGSAPENGGAIYDEGPGSLNVSHCAFTGNTAGGDGGIAVGSGIGHGGAIYASFSAASLSVTDCAFTANTAGGDGGSGERGGRGRGGAIDYEGDGAVTISGSAFTANAAGGDGEVGSQGGVGRGGSIFVAGFAASTSVSSSTFTDNTAGGDGGAGNLSGRGEGGAIEGESGTGAVTVTNSTFTENVAGGQNGGGSGSGFGVGGVIRSFGSLIVTGSTFTDNAAGGKGGAGFGGAINNFDNVSPLIVSGSTFADNAAGGQGGTGAGGAISVSSVSGRSASITDSTLVENAAGGGSANGSGGAIEAADLLSLTLASVTISGNAVGGNGSGAGINSATGALSRAATVTARATIISGNTGATNCDAPVATSSYSLEGPASGDASCGFDLSSDDPQLQPLADNGGPTKTQALPPSSPAVDGVPVAKCPTKIDQRGEPRPDNGKSFCDVGAFELQDPLIAPAVFITSPVDGATYAQGQVVAAVFTCTEGIDGPGIASCVDQNGRLPGAPLDTSATGRHTLTVTATSEHGLTSRASVAYVVVARVAPKVPAPQRPGVLLSYRQVGGIGGPRPSLDVLKDRKARLRLGGCIATFTLRPAVWGRLEAALRRAHLHAIAGNYPPPQGSADMVTYVVKTSDAVVRIASPQPQHRDVTRALRPLLKALNRMVSAGKRQLPSSCKIGQ